MFLLYAEQWTSQKLSKASILFIIVFVEPEYTALKYLNIPGLSDQMVRRVMLLIFHVSLSFLQAKGCCVVLLFYVHCKQLWSCRAEQA